MSHVQLPEVEVPNYAFHSLAERLENREQPTARNIGAVVTFFDKAFRAFGEPLPNEDYSDTITAYRLLANGLPPETRALQSNQVHPQLRTYRDAIAQLGTPLSSPPELRGEIVAYLHRVRTQPPLENLF